MENNEKNINETLISYLEDTSKNNSEILNNTDDLLFSNSLNEISESMQINLDEIDEDLIVKSNKNIPDEDYSIDSKILEFIPERKMLTNKTISLKKKKSIKKAKRRISNKNKKINR